MTERDEDSFAGRTFYRYVGEREVSAIEETGMLRGGRGAGRETTFWTDERYDSAEEAQRRLALRVAPDARVAFRIRGEPGLVLEDAEVEPDGSNTGGGREWMTLDAVEVEVISVDYFA